MKSMIITIPAKQRVARNTMHFQTQLNNRVLIQENKKAYNRKKLKQADLRQIY